MSNEMYNSNPPTHFPLNKNVKIEKFITKYKYAQKHFYLIAVYKKHE